MSDPVIELLRERIRALENRADELSRQHRLDEANLVQFQADKLREDLTRQRERLQEGGNV